MKHPVNILIIAGFILVTIFTCTSCKKESGTPVPAGQQRVQIRLSDDPIPFNSVFVDIQRVEVQVIPDSCLNRYGDDDDHDGEDDRDHDQDSRCSVWDTLNIHPGIYDLLHLANGTDTILATGFTVAGRIAKIRLTLG